MINTIPAGTLYFCPTIWGASWNFTSRRNEHENMIVCINCGWGTGKGFLEVGFRVCFYNLTSQVVVVNDVK
jgi:hypothetical protein